LWASAARASATASPTPTTAAIPSAVTTTVSTAIRATITAASEILAGAVAAAARRVILCGIVVRCKVLRCGSVGFGLAFVTGFGMLFLYRSRGSYVVMIFDMFAFTGVHFVVRSVMLFSVMRFFLVEFVVVRLFVMFAGARQGLTGKHFDGSTVGGRL
jgi:uncharacterized membrane protein